MNDQVTGNQKINNHASGWKNELTGDHAFRKTRNLLEGKHREVDGVAIFASGARIGNQDNDTLVKIALDGIQFHARVWTNLAVPDVRNLNSPSTEI